MGMKRQNKIATLKEDAVLSLQCSVPDRYYQKTLQHRTSMAYTPYK